MIRVMVAEITPPAIDIRELRVDYGNFVAVQDLSLTVPAGEIFGLVGPNGAGKTSTFKVLATLAEPTYGDVSLCGVDIREKPEEARRLLGYMPDLAPVPSDLKVWEFLDMFATCHGVPNPRRRVVECLEKVQLTDKADVFCKSLSRGMTQRLVLAKTLLHRPRVLILDEPASGMDPLSRLGLRETLRELVVDGSTVIVSSHILTELSEMCTTLGIMKHGRMLASGTADEIRAVVGSDSTNRHLSLTLAADKGVDAASILNAQNGILNLKAEGPRRLSFEFDGTEDDQAALLVRLIQAGLPIATFEERKTSFEDMLIKVARDGNDPRVVPAER